MLYGIFRFDGYYEITLQKGGSEGEESACNVGDPNSIPGLGRSHGKGYPLQYSGLERVGHSRVTFAFTVL